MIYRFHNPSYYRFVWHTSLYAPEGDGLGDPPSAFFDQLPGKSLLTLGVDAPHNWMVTPIRADEDLDNLRLIDIAARTGDHRIEAEFELEYLLLEGHCLDESTRQPPRGLQFTLGTAEKLDRYDTIVMANLVSPITFFHRFYYLPSLLSGYNCVPLSNHYLIICLCWC